eukprot:3324131-Amphidinium_carterae.1
MIAHSASIAVGWFLHGVLAPDLPTAEAQLTRLDAWVTGRKKRIQAERTASWRAYVKEMWATGPKKIYKWIRGTAA